ncbi:MAG TPA: ABC transporter substrate-binding protein [Polyangiales bacterium]|nr:ABC transporter substrate-binding protein [Polyangiales bacterium]
MRSAVKFVGALLVFAQVSCSQILGLDDKSIRDADASSEEAIDQTPSDEPLGAACVRNSDCLRSLTDKGAPPGPLVCVPETGRCTPLLSEDCDTLTGDYKDDRAIVIASLLSTTGAQAATNLARQQSAILAVEQINMAGGIPRGVPPVHRPLVMLSCDEVANLPRVARHLIEELHVPAIVGPNTSQDTLDLSNQFSVRGGTLLMSPTAVASSIADLLDAGLTWTMVPSDVQRAPLMLQQINQLEAQLKRERNKSVIKLGVLFRDDALGQGTRSALDTLTLNGRRLPDPENLSTAVKLSPYRVGEVDQSALVAEYVAFAPDIIVLAGTAEAVTQLLVPLERSWGDQPRPHYVAIDSVKVPELLDAVASNDELRQRIRGTGVLPTAASKPVFDAFRLDFRVRYPLAAVTNAISGMGPAYDATLAIAYAIAANGQSPVTGANIARGLARLAGGSPVELRSTKILAAFQELAAGRAIEAVGTFGPLAWNASGSPLGGLIEIWCLGVAAGKPTYESAGLTFDVASQQTRGAFTPCKSDL